MDQLLLDQVGVTKDIRENITHAMMMSQIYLKEVVGHGKLSDPDSDDCLMIDFQETKVAAMWLLESKQL